MKIVIPGGSGQIGGILARAFHRDGHEVVVLSRRDLRNVPWRVARWDGHSLGAWRDELEAADAVINLTGATVNCRYNPANRRDIIESRVNSVRVLGEAIQRSTEPPRVWLQAGTATIYAHRYDAGNDEETGILGGSELNVPDTWRFSLEVAQAWERAFDEAGPLPGTRKVMLRSAMTMSPDRGGVFDVLFRLVRFGLGGPAGDGRQYVSWIHDNDFVRAIYYLIERQSLAGPVNLTSPHPVPNAEFMATLREVRGLPFGLPAPKPLLELGALLLRTETELILKSRRVIPTRLVRDGFEFEFPTWKEAARDLCRRWYELSKPLSG